MRKGFFWQGLAAVAIVATIAGCGEENEDRIEASGTVEATEANVAVKVGGLIAAILPAEGEWVDAGQVVALVDSVDQVWQRKQADAGLDLARANLELAFNGPRPEEIAQAAAAVLQAAVQRDAAQTDLGRVEILAEAGTATPKQLDDARARLQGAEAGLNLAEAGLARLRAGTRPEQIAAAHAQLAMAEAQAGAARQRVADCAVRAPFSGVITQRLAEPGETVAPGGAILTLARLDPVRLKVFLTEVEVGRIRLGQAVQVVLDAWPQTPRTGRVAYISPTAEFTPKNVQTREDRVKLVFAVEIELDNGDGLLKPGLPADAWFVEGNDGAGD